VHCARFHHRDDAQLAWTAAAWINREVDAARCRHDWDATLGERIDPRVVDHAACVARRLAHELALRHVLLTLAVEEHGLLSRRRTLRAADAIVHVRALPGFGALAARLADLDEVYDTCRVKVRVT